MCWLGSKGHKIICHQMRNKTWECKRVLEKNEIVLNHGKGSGVQSIMHSPKKITKLHYIKAITRLLFLYGYFWLFISVWYRRWKSLQVRINWVCKKKSYTTKEFKLSPETFVLVLIVIHTVINIHSCYCLPVLTMSIVYTQIITLFSIHSCYIV